MSARDTHPPPDSTFQRDIRIHTDLAETRTTVPATDADNSLDSTNTLSPISSNAMNSLNSASLPSQGSPKPSKTSNGTIRSVPSESLHLETTMFPQDEDPRRFQSKSDPTAQSSSSKTYGALSTSQPPLSWQNNLPVSNGLVRGISSEFGPTKNYSSSNIRLTEDSSSSNGLTSPDSGTPQWSSAVGRANLGKSGRVIERLMGENDMLKRDLQIERLRAEEGKQALKMVEARMEAMATDHEREMNDVSVMELVLKRRERQLEDLRAQVDSERLKAEKALEREKQWKDAMEEMEVECKKKVEEAQMYAAMMEGRNNTMVNHWKDQGALVDKTVVSLGKEIQTIVTERRNDDQKILTLQNLRDQQAAEIATLRRNNAALHAAHEKYKVVQEEGLREIKRNAKRNGEVYEERIRESEEVLRKLKWALGVHENVKSKE